MGGQRRVTVIDYHVLRHVLAHNPTGRSWTVRTLAETAHVGRALLGHLLTGTRGTLPRSTAQRIAEAIQCPPEVLFMPWLSTESDDQETP